MDNIFNSLPEEVASVEPKVETKVDDANVKSLMKSAMAQTLKNVPNYNEIKGTKSECFEVTATLGFGDKGNIVVDKTSKERKVVPTSKIEGYKVKNVSDEPIPYETEVYAENEDGIFVGTVVEKVAAPGEEIQLSRKYMTKKFSPIEYNFTLANGQIVKGPKRLDAPLDEYLEAHYFKYNKNLNLSVNDDEVKKNIGEKHGDDWKVKPEYVETFGYLNNPKEVNRGKARKEKITTAELQANLVRMLLEQE